MTTNPLPNDAIAIIPKGKTRRIEVKLTTFKSEQRLDIREYYQNEVNGWQPTQRGIAIPCDNRITLLIEAIQKAQDVINSTKEAI